MDINFFNNLVYFKVIYFFIKIFQYSEFQFSHLFRNIDLVIMRVDKTPFGRAETLQGAVVECFLFHS